MKLKWKLPSLRGIWKKLVPDWGRETKKRITYIGVGFAMLCLSFLCVYLSHLLFTAEQGRLFDRDTYIAVNIPSAEHLEQTLSLATRVDLFSQTKAVGASREASPGEISSERAIEIAAEMWDSMLDEHAHNVGNVMYSGDNPAALTEQRRSQIMLRDFYNEETGARLSLWCAQLYAISAKGETYTLSTMLDSRTGEPYYVSFSLFDNVNSNSIYSGINGMCEALGYHNVALANATTRPFEGGITITIPLDEFVMLQKHCYYDSEYAIELVKR